jgi:hypothetical protein
MIVACVVDGRNAGRYGARGRLGPSLMSALGHKRTYAVQNEMVSFSLQSDRESGCRRCRVCSALSMPM